MGFSAAILIVAASAAGTVALLGGSGPLVTVLGLRRVGRFVVACGRDRRSTVTFVPDRLLPTADVVVSGARGTEAGTVQPERPRTAWRRPAAVLSETWQIEPFAASALALTVPDQGATRMAGGRRPDLCAGAR